MLNLFVIPGKWRWDFDFQDCVLLFRRACEHKDAELFCSSSAEHDSANFVYPGT